MTLAGWLRGWLRGWLGGWLGGYIHTHKHTHTRTRTHPLTHTHLHTHVHIPECGEEGGSQTKNPSKRIISRSLAELKLYQKNIHKTCRQAVGCPVTTGNCHCFSPPSARNYIHLK